MIHTWLPCRLRAPAAYHKLWRRVKWFGSVSGWLHSHGLNLDTKDKCRIEFQNSVQKPSWKTVQQYSTAWVRALVLCVLLLSLTFLQCRCRLQSQSMQSGCRTRSPQRRGRGSQKTRPLQKRYLCGGGYWFRSACKVLSFPLPSHGQQWEWGEPRPDQLPVNKIHGRFRKD